MSLTRAVAAASHDPARAVELAQILELEASWEILRAATPRPGEAKPTVQDLQVKQRAYEVFRAKLAAYAKKYGAVHVPEALLNSPAKLGEWSRAVAALYRQVEADPRAAYPTHLMEKAFRWADRVADRTNQGRPGRPTPPAAVGAAVAALDALARWCDSLVRVAPAA
jgi:hypothetical protein